MELGGARLNRDAYRGDTIKPTVQMAISTIAGSHTINAILPGSAFRRLSQ